MNIALPVAYGGRSIASYMRHLALGVVLLLAAGLASAQVHELASLQRRVLPETARLGLLSPDARAMAQRLGPNHPMLEDFAFELLGASPFQIISAWAIRNGPAYCSEKCPLPRWMRPSVAALPTR